MKKLVLLALTFSIVAVLGAALTGASPNEAPTESGKPCCQISPVSPEVVASLPNKNSNVTKCGDSVCPSSKENASCCKGFTETSDDAYAVKLIQAHSKVVSLWIKNGHSELPRNHAAPVR